MGLFILVEVGTLLVVFFVVGFVSGFFGKQVLDVGDLLLVWLVGLEMVVFELDGIFGLQHYYYNFNLPPYGPFLDPPAFASLSLRYSTNGAFGTQAGRAQSFRSGLFWTRDIPASGQCSEICNKVVD
jgi:hypothetical protein